MIPAVGVHRENQESYFSACSSHPDDPRRNGVSADLEFLGRGSEHNLHLGYGRKIAFHHGILDNVPLSRSRVHRDRRDRKEGLLWKREMFGRLSNLLRGRSLGGGLIKDSRTSRSDRLHRRGCHLRRGKAAVVK